MEIANTKNNRFYELVCILRQDISSVDLENIKKDLISLITSYDGKIEEKNIRYIGLKSLAYPIKKNTKGNYMIFGFEANNNECLNELKRKNLYIKKKRPYILLSIYVRSL